MSFARLVAFSVVVGLGLWPMVGCQSFSGPASAKQLADQSFLCTQWAQKVEKTLNEGNPHYLTSTFDWDAFGERLVKRLNLSFFDRRGFLNGFRKSSKGNLGETLCEVTRRGGRYTFLRVRHEEGTWKAVFRMMHQGVNYQEFHLQMDRKGMVRVVDVYMATTGELMSETAARTSQSFLKAGSSMSSEIETCKAVSERYRQHMLNGESRQALEALDQLPTQFQTHRWVLHAKVLAAANVDAKRHAEGVEAILKQFPGDPSTHLMAIDYFLNKNDFKRTLESIEVLNRRMGGDPALDAMSARILFLSGNISEALRRIDQALAQEPTLKSAHWAHLEIALNAKDFGRVAKSLDALKSLGEPVGDLRGNPQFALFVRSPEYTAWKKGTKMPDSQKSTEKSMVSGA